MKKRSWLEPLGWWVLIAVPITLVLLIAYAIVQQNYRESLNDPQIQMAEDAAASLENGAQLDQVVPTGKVDIANSLAPWLAVYNAQGVPLLADAQLNGAPPQLPQGVFDTSTWGYPIIGHHLNGSPVDQNRFTWQPNPAVRQAVVLVYMQGPTVYGYVAAGRNMREIEQRIEHEGEIVFVGWLFTLAATFVTSFLVWWVLRRAI